MERITRDGIRSLGSPAERSPAVPPTLTVYVAVPGTPVADDTGRTHPSAAGHVYYSISDGRTENGYGFSPIVTGWRGPGHVVRNEHLSYKEPVYARTLEITPEQYARLKAFGEAGARGDRRFFSLDYNGATNSCIDFTWKALEHAGLKRELRVLPGVRMEMPEGYEGTLKPNSNIRDFERLAPPVPGSPLNRTERNPLPPQTRTQRLITENGVDDRAAPGPRVAGTTPPDDPRHAQIRDAVHRLDAARGRMPDEASDRLIAGLYAAVAANRGIPAVHDVALSTATADHPAGRMAFAVYRPFGEREPVLHAGVDVQSALSKPPAEHYREAELVQQVNVQAQALQHEAAQPQKAGGARSPALAG